LGGKLPFAQFVRGGVVPARRQSETGMKRCDFIIFRASAME
jgi:hypothetical protein